MSTAHIRLAAAFMLVTAGFCLAPGEVRASCGDYLEMSRHAQRPQPNRREEPLCPCQGPSCSARIPLPAIPPATPDAPIGPREVFFQHACLALNEPEQAWFTTLDANPADPVLGGRLFRPPRVL